MAAVIPRFLRDQHGLGAGWRVVVPALLIVILSVPLDAANGWRLQTIAQSAADAAALAAAADLPSEAKARAAATAYVSKNIPEAYSGELLTAGISVGRWTASHRVFAPEADIPDAVRVTLRRTGPSVGAYVIGMLGFRTWDGVVSATAFRPVGHCTNDSTICGTLPALVE